MRALGPHAEWTNPESSVISLRKIMALFTSVGSGSLKLCMAAVLNRTDGAEYTP